MRSNCGASTHQEKSHRKSVILYMKGTPDFPQCGFSARTCGAEILQRAVRTEHHEDEEVYRACRSSRTGDFPQLYVKGELIGAATSPHLQQSGELQKMLTRGGQGRGLITSNSRKTPAKAAFLFLACRRR